MLYNIFFYTDGLEEERNIHYIYYARVYCAKTAFWMKVAQKGRIHAHAFLFHLSPPSLSFSLFIGISGETALPQPSPPHNCVTRHPVVSRHRAISRSSHRPPWANCRHVIVGCHSKYRMSPIYIISDNARYYHNKDLREWAEETNFFLTIKEAWSNRPPSIYWFILYKNTFGSHGAECSYPQSLSEVASVVTWGTLSRYLSLPPSEVLLEPFFCWEMRKTRFFAFWGGKWYFFTSYAFRNR